MELFKHLISEIDFNACESLEEVARDVNDEIENLGLPFEEALRSVLAELGSWNFDMMIKTFNELEDAERLKTAVYDIFEFEEELAGKYVWDITDVIVGLLQAQATPEIRERLNSLPLWGTYEAENA